jgi:hypothetical protein
MDIHTIILENTTSSGITIPDLSGLYIPASGTIDITDLFPNHRLEYSADLESYITSSGIVVNIDTFDLSPDRALRFFSPHDATSIQGFAIGHQIGTQQVTTVSGQPKVLKYDAGEGLVGFDSLEFLELKDTPTTYSGRAGQTATVNPTEDGMVLTYAQPGATATGTLPPDPQETNLWYSSEDHQLYYWDENRADWLSIMSHYYMWTNLGAADGSYMSIGNLSHSSAYYYIPRAATVISVSSSAQKTQESSKGFQIETAASGTVLEFSHTDWVYRDNTVNVRLDPEDEMKAYITSAGQSIRNPIVTLEIKWRYEA